MEDIFLPSLIPALSIPFPLSLLIQLDKYLLYIYFCSICFDI